MPNIIEFLRLIPDLGWEFGPPVAVLLYWIASLIRRRNIIGPQKLSVLIDPERRKLALGLALALGVYYAGYFSWRHWHGLPPPFATGEIGILIAQVLGDSSGSTQVAYQTAIRQEIDKSPELKAIVKARLIERTLPTDLESEHAEALRLCHLLNATFVLRPHSAASVQEPWLTLCTPVTFSKDEALLKTFPDAQLVDLDHLRLPSDLALLARCVLASALFYQRNYQKVVDGLRAVLASPALPDIDFARADINFRLGTAIMYGEPPELAEEAVNAFRQAIRIDPQLPGSHNNLGVVLAWQGKYDDAIAEFLKTVGLSPSAQDAAVAHYNIGLALHFRGQSRDAIDQFRQATKGGINFSSVHTNLCADLANEGDYENAIDECRRALTLDGNSAIAHNNLGLALRLEGRHEDAMAELNRAKLLDPQSATVHNSLCMAYQDAREFDSALLECQQAVSLDSRLQDARYNLGLAFLQKSRYKDAADQFTNLIDINPHYVHADTNLCFALTHQQRYREAVLACTRALKLDPHDYHALSILSEASRGLGSQREVGKNPLPGLTRK